MTHTRRIAFIRPRTALLAAGFALLGLSLGVVPPAGAASGGSIALVAYSTPKPAYAALITAFNATAAGQGVTFSQSFGPSGTQATSVTEGLPADVVNFSLDPDMAKVVAAGLVAPTWDDGPTKGIVTDSIVSFIVRPGNPLHIKTWADLVKPGVQVITPNPFSSGSAKWNLMAAYGAQLALHKTPAQALAFLAALLKNTVAQPASASTALQTFLSGQGDVVLDYESDAIYAQDQNEPISIVTPPQTILIQNPIAVTTKAADPTAANAFVKYLLSAKGQTVWAEQGYRPVLPKIAARFDFPTPKKLFTIASLGGWTSVDTTFFTPVTGKVAAIEASLGQPDTSS
jgi:sulfate transport system substrate-binding protein